MSGESWFHGAAACAYTAGLVAVLLTAPLWVGVCVAPLLAVPAAVFWWLAWRER